MLERCRLLCVHQFVPKGGGQLVVGQRIHTYVTGVGITSIRCYQESDVNIVEIGREYRGNLT